jgi:hypothetical protein
MGRLVADRSTVEVMRLALARPPERLAEHPDDAKANTHTSKTMGARMLSSDRDANVSEIHTFD